MGLNTSWAKLLGFALLIVGILGFFTGDMLFGFGINNTHNIVHMATGLFGLWAGFSAGGQRAKGFNVLFGIVYLVVAVLGFVSMPFFVTFLSLNAADNWLHLFIGVTTTAVGLWA